MNATRTMQAARLGSALAAIALLGSAELRPARAEEATGAIERLAWLAGCWERSAADRTIEEQWMAARGGAMLGMGRTVVAGRLSEYEFMRIEEREGLLVFTASPSAQTTTSFPAIELGADRVVFENLTHDFPQRVIYARASDGSLAARIEGKLDGVPRGIDFTFRRVACPSGTTP
jgi:hypothetical protein